MNDGIVAVSVNAGPLTVTGNVHGRTHQISMGPRLHLHITADVARQWIDTLNTITEESN